MSGRFSGQHVANSGVSSAKKTSTTSKPTAGTRTGTTATERSYYEQREAARRYAQQNYGRSNIFTTNNMLDDAPVSGSTISQTPFTTTTTTVPDSDRNSYNNYDGNSFNNNYGENNGHSIKSSSNYEEDDKEFQSNRNSNTITDTSTRSRRASVDTDGPFSRADSDVPVTFINNNPTVTSPVTIDNTVVNNIATNRNTSDTDSNISSVAAASTAVSTKKNVKGKSLWDNLRSVAHTLLIFPMMFALSLLAISVVDYLLHSYNVVNLIATTLSNYDNSIDSNSFYHTIITTMLSYEKEEVAFSFVFGLVIALLLDQDVVKTNQIVGNFLGFSSDNIKKINHYQDLNSKENGIGAIASSNSTIGDKHAAYSHTVTVTDDIAKDQDGNSAVTYILNKVLQILIIAFNLLPYKVKYFLVLFSIMATIRIIFYKQINNTIVNTITVTTNVLLPSIVSMIVLFLSLYIIIKIIFWRYTFNKKKKVLVKSLSYMAKEQLLQKHNGGPYPIEFLRCEMTDLIRLHNLRIEIELAKKHNNFDEGDENIDDGDDDDDEFTRLAQSYKSPKSEKRRVSFSFLSPFSSGKKTTQTPNSRRTSHGNSSYSNYYNTTIDMLGYHLKSLWSLVITEVEKDERIQSVDLIVEGAQRKCWRILSGDTLITNKLTGR